MGLFYPDRLPKNKWFQYYAEHFNTVEINNTFYQLPKPQSLERWHHLAPKNFIYSVKANRYITHIKRLKDTSEPLKLFFEIVYLLKEHLGPILYQLPPSLHKNLDRLAAFIKFIPKKSLAAFEFGHESWFSDDTFDLLDQAGLGFCIHDMPAVPSPRVITGNLIYIRFHGPTARYAGSYSKAQLKNWAHWLKQHSKKTPNIYVYFNNDYNAYAVKNAKTLKEQFHPS